MQHLISKIKYKKDEITLLFIAILGLILRLKGIGKPNLWFDEVASITNASKNIAQIIKAEINLPPLYNLFLHFWIYVFGKSEFAVRLPSVLFGVGIIFLVYKLTKRLFSSRVGLLAAFIVAIAPYQIYYSQETRMYSLITLLCLWASYFFLLACEEKKNRFWFFYIISVTASFYTHYYALSIVLFHGFFLSFFWKENKQNLYKWGLCQIIILGLFACWIPIVINSMHSGGIAWATWLLKRFGPLTQLGFIFFIFTVSYSAITYLPPQKLSGGIKTLIDIPFSGYFLIITFITVIIICLGIFKLSKIWKRRSIFILFYFFVPIAAAFFMFFLLKQQLTATKYLIIASPPYYILLSLGLTGIKHKGFKGVLFLLLVGIMGYSLYNYYYNPKFGKGQWFNVANYIGENSRKEDLIVIHKPYVDIAFNYYYRGTNAQWRLPISSSIDEEKFMDEFERENRGYQRIWLIISHNFDTKLFYKELFDRHFILVDKKIFSVGYMVGVYLYKKVERE